MSNHTLTKAEQLLLKEYELRAGQMLHEDKLRHQLITFVITLSTAVIGGLFYLDQFYCDFQLKPIIIISISLLIILILISIIIIAKIRKAQLLSMKICENIREYFYKQNYEYHIINILRKSEFPTEPNYRKPSQTLWFVYLLSFFNSFLIIYLISVIVGIYSLEVFSYILIWFIFFYGHILFYSYRGRWHHENSNEMFSSSSPKTQNRLQAPGSRPGQRRAG